MIANDDAGKAFTQLWVAHSPRVFAYIHTLMPSSADAEEILQETGIVLWEKFEQFDRQTDFGRWACRVAYFETLKQRKRLAQSHRYFSDDFLAIMAKRAVVVADSVSPMLESVGQCMEGLATADRQLLALRHASNATTDSVAERLGRSAGGIRKSLRRIYRVLFECVERQRRQEEHS